ncbi:unnamed protein product [Leptidea sinapis]|uniref:Uncharacterized protein n=1 Tax=Leptidea sinapis TaxID=189913 RepID=A0A5E4QZ26_9NEOP|nr:unnamed protein product [Leptidea sinapis]
MYLAVALIIIIASLVKLQYHNAPPRGYVLSNKRRKSYGIPPPWFYWGRVDHLGRNVNDGATSYLEFPSNERQLNLIARASKDMDHEQLDYDSLIEGNPSPTHCGDTSM